jgi:hypothetical protein
VETYFDNNNEALAMKQFVDNMKRVSGATIVWDRGHALKAQKELRQVEEEIIVLFDDNTIGVFIDVEFGNLKVPKERKKCSPRKGGGAMKVKK